MSEIRNMVFSALGAAVICNVMWVTAINLSDRFKEDQVKVVEQQIPCPDGIISSGYGKMEVGDGQIYHVSGVNKESMELKISKDNARNYADDIGRRYKLVEVFYKDVD